MSMKDFHLHWSSGHVLADVAVQEAIRLYEDAFPGQIAAYYIEGSYADNTYLTTSDIDLKIVFRNCFAHEDIRKTAGYLWENSAYSSTLEMDIIVIDEDSLCKGVDPLLKLGSRLIYGEDICLSYPILPIDIWTRERMHIAYWLLVRIYQRSVPVHTPLLFPDATDKFYGYANRFIRMSDGRTVPCTRNLVRTTGWVATALLALQTGQYATKKRACAQLYRQYIGDEWSSLLEDLSIFCREKWNYLIPAEEQERQQLRSICERTLQFEQHFLSIYIPYLFEQLRSVEPEQSERARWVQEQIPFENPHSDIS